METSLLLMIKAQAATFAPALANAWFRLTGNRQRTLPFVPGATMGG